MFAITQQRLIFKTSNVGQERIKERNQQVQLMGKIFKGARKVIVWLGEDYDDSKAGMQLLKQLLSISRYKRVKRLTSADLEAHGLPSRGSRRWTALSAMLRRPWFWRTWVVQEVVLNPHVELVLGTSANATITWDDLERVVSLIEGPMPRAWQLDQAISSFELPFSRINRIRLRHQRLIATPVTPHFEESLFDTPRFEEPESDLVEEDDHAPQLLDLLLMSRGLGATDPRDKIYALLGLSQHNVDPDYSQTPEIVFTKFAEQTVDAVNEIKAGSLDVSSNLREVRRAMILISCAGRHHQRLQLPTWVPDWTVNLSSRPLVFGLDHRFSAGGDKLAMFQHQGDSHLQLCGKLLDTVTAAGTFLLDYDEVADASPSDIIQSWWVEAQEIATTRIVRSPGSTFNLDAFEAMRRDLSLCKHGYFVGSAKRGRRNSLLDDTAAADEDIHSPSQTLTLGPTRGRILFTSSTGYIGLAPYGTKEGDLVFIVMGADVPFVLRPGEDCYELIGEAYVQGVMNGEILLMEHIPVQDVFLK